MIDDSGVELGVVVLFGLKENISHQTSPLVEAFYMEIICLFCLRTL